MPRTIRRNVRCSRSNTVAISIALRPIATPRSGRFGNRPSNRDASLEESTRHLGDVRGVRVLALGPSAGDPRQHSPGRSRPIAGPGAVRDADRPVRSAPDRHTRSQAGRRVGARSIARVRPDGHRSSSRGASAAAGCSIASWSRWSSRATCRSSATPRPGRHRRQGKSSRTPVMIGGRSPADVPAMKDSIARRDRPDSAAQPSSSARIVRSPRCPTRPCGSAAAAGPGTRPSAADTRAIATTLRDAGAGVTSARARASTARCSCWAAIRATLPFRRSCSPASTTT